MRICVTCHPRAALTFYGPEHGRQVRVRGTVTAARRRTARRTSSAAPPPPARRPCWAARAST
ncbi:pyridoxamine 5'-phosphate oxidase family protein [Streptomyces sp. NPDC001581]|uniref:pyridoxamine 5'-phosphate oxidase family protein n=1 Tax=Streptomyces sp. NPDC001581 TaxID=3154386 RepID=UPI00331EA4CA